MKGRGRCGRRKHEKLETEEGRRGFPRQGLKLDQMQRTMDPKDLRKGRGRGALQSDQTGLSFITASGRTTDTLRGQCESKLSHGQCKSTNHSWNELCQQRYCLIWDPGPRDFTLYFIQSSQFPAWRTIIVLHTPL